MALFTRISEVTAVRMFVHLPVVNVLAAVFDAVYHTIPYLTPEGTELFMSLLCLSWRTRVYTCLHILRVLREVTLGCLRREGSSLELFLLKILKAPKEMEIEHSEDSLLAVELVHVVEAAYKVYGPPLSRILHPTMRTELVSGTGFPRGLWVWHADHVDAERFVILYYLHGGGYCFFDGITSHLELATRMIAKLQADLFSAGGVRVKVVAFILDYTLAPKAVLPTQLEEAVEGYRFLLSQDRFLVEARDVVISGDSAGGALVLSLLKCLDEGAFGCASLARPGCAHAVSPMLSFSRSLAREAYNFNRDFLSNCLLWYSASCALYGRPSRPGERCGIGHRPFNGESSKEASSSSFESDRISAPAGVEQGQQERSATFSFDDANSATFAGIPILVQAGGSEGFLDEILDFVKRVDDAVTLEVYEDRFHIFPMLSWIIPQGKTAIEHWASFATMALTGKPLTLGQHFAVCPAGSMRPHPDLDWVTTQ